MHVTSLERDTPDFIRLKRITLYMKLFLHFHTLSRISNFWLQNNQLYSMLMWLSHTCVEPSIVVLHGIDCECVNAGFGVETNVTFAVITLWCQVTITIQVNPCTGTWNVVMGPADLRLWSVDDTAKWRVWSTDDGNVSDSTRCNSDCLQHTYFKTYLTAQVDNLVQKVTYPPDREFCTEIYDQFTCTCSPTVSTVSLNSELNIKQLMF